MKKNQSFEFSPEDRICILGSCICDEFASRFSEAGFAVLSNPFGPLYNPLSVESSVNRLESGTPFTGEDCVRVGAGSDLICSFSHYTKFARPSKEEFLQNANSSLEKAAAFWKSCNKVLVILYTAYVWEHGGNVVSNCLKRPAAEFVHRLISVNEAKEAILRMQGGDKDFLFMVCPIRQGGEDCRINTLAKSTLELAIAEAGARYFPLYELFMDKLRDCGFYRDDGLHPNAKALDIAFSYLV